MLSIDYGELDLEGIAGFIESKGKRIFPVFMKKSPY
jgi:hypothetical protein